MQVRSTLFACIALGFAGFVSAQAVPVPCEALRSLTLSGGSILSAAVVLPGQFEPPLPATQVAAGGSAFGGLPAFCRVEAALTPTPSSDIRIEVWLPTAGWNGKLQVVGNGGFAGAIGYLPLGAAVAAGYVAAATDTGHRGSDPVFMQGQPERVTDFAHRAVHELTVAAKWLSARFYGEGPRLSYFNGCSTGGRQALTAAQRYPTDFDGIVAGAPANNTVRMTSMQIWSGLAGQADQTAVLSSPQLLALHQAVIAACDRQDGVADGVLENPAACRLDAQQLACSATATDACLTEGQVGAAARMYAGPANPRTQEPIFPGLARGSELGWEALTGSQPFAYALGMWRYALLGNPDWNPGLLDFDRLLPEAHRVAERTGLQAVDTNLEAFFDHGGKLLLYHGWNDPLISPFNSVDYYNGVLRTTSGGAADSIRLFMMPGVNHCTGGSGPDTWDKLSVLDAWRSGGEAPTRILAARVRDGQTDRTRPLCAYPHVATYTGSGSTDDATHFVCR